MSERQQVSPAVAREREEWVQTTLGDVAELVRGVTYKSSELGNELEGVPFLSLKSVAPGGGFRGVYKTFTGTVKPDRVLAADDLVIAVTEQTRDYTLVGAPALVPEALAGTGATFSMDLVKVKPTSNVVSTAFLSCLLQGPNARRFMAERAPGMKVLHLRTGEVPTFKFSLPPLHTQAKILEVINAVDDQITALNAEADSLDALLRARKENLFAHYAATETALPIGEVLGEIKRPIKVAHDAKYRQIGIRSHGRGLFTKDEVTGESLGSKKVFWVEPGDLVINIVFAWEGAVAIVPPEIKGYCGSHRFPTYRRLDGGDIEFFRLFFSTETGKRILSNCSPGGAGRNRTLSRKRLMQSPVGMPPAHEQERAICELQALEATVVAVRTEADQLRAMRARLLSGLLDRTIEIESAELGV
ncbi:restriction endonuclease subunit S [Streptomyces sp. NPDC048430]|uniref:restriction endonuclease subunit S n=1 Tax=Streptomyces sp. NPDC048430 TaxID=3155388 RepID=UPI0034422113